MVIFIQRKGINRRPPPYPTHSPFPEPKNILLCHLWFVEIWWRLGTSDHFLIVLMMWLIKYWQASVNIYCIEQNSIVHSNLSTDAIRPPRKSGSEAAYRSATYARGGAKIFTTDVSSLMLITWFVCLILWTNYQILIKYPYLIFYALFRVLAYCSMVLQK